MKAKAIHSGMLEAGRVIKKSGNKWILYTKDGKRKLGTHSTRAEALAQEKAVHANRDK